MMASALKRCYDKQTHFRKKISVEEQRAQKDNRFLRGRQIATGSCDEIQGLSGLFRIKLGNDDIQEFDSRWEQALLLTSDLPSDKVSEGLYVSKLQDSSQVQTILALYNQEILRGGGQRDYHRLRMCVKLHFEQAQKKWKSQDSEPDYRACGRQLKERDKIPSPSGRQESALSARKMVLVQKETLVVFYIRTRREPERNQRKERRIQEYQASNQPLITSEGEKVKGKHPLLYRREKDGQTTNARKVWRPDLRLELKFLVYVGQDVENRRVIIDILSCVVITSLETDASMAAIACFDMLMVRWNSARGRRARVLKEQLRHWKKKKVQGCVF